MRLQDKPVIPAVPIGRQREHIGVVGYADTESTLIVETPEGRTDIDLIAVERAVNGDRKGWTLTAAEARYAAQLLFDRDVSYSVIARLIGVSGSTLKKWFPELAVPSSPQLTRKTEGLVEVRCGTMRGYRRHRKRGEAPCDKCRAANTAAYRHYCLHGTTVGAPEAAA